MIFATAGRRLGLGIAVSCAMLLLLAGTRDKVTATSDSRSDPLTKAFRTERNGWVYIHLEGSPEEIGYQHGYLLAREIDESLRVFKKYLPHTTKRDWQFYRDSAHELFWKKIGDEYQKEIEGIARGASARGVKIDTDDVLAMNAW
ncbi:MAG TPA: hypothetical protein VK651_09130, partial [Blastocatellia bacterium]|nr:hypothetical protein [Blastocatellia bacterium]